VLVKPILALLGWRFNFRSDHPNANITVDVAIAGVPKGIYYPPQHFVLKSLYPLDVILLGQPHSCIPYVQTGFMT
jgi:hypothetical protein